MNRLDHKRQNAAQRSNRVRAKVQGTSAQPRLCVRVTNQRVWAQIIDDETGRTLVSATADAKSADTMTKRAEVAGSAIAKAAAKAKIGKVALDRGSHKYHGRVKAFAEAARAEGLEF